MSGLRAKANALLEAGKPAVLVTITEALGSTPREAGAQMLVTENGYYGTIGGGTLEWLALAEAQSLLGKPQAIRTLAKSLGPDLGQCCGGRVTLQIETLTNESLRTILEDCRTQVHLWGAGHVGRALVLALAPLPFEITWWDMRPNAFPSAVPGNVTCRTGAPPEMQEHGFVLVMTHSHALDFEIVDFALRNPSFAQVGLIGSDTKASRFRRRLREAGVDDARLTCPIGSKAITSKLPAAIAATVAVQLLEWQQVLKTSEIPVSALSQSFKVAT